MGASLPYVAVGLAGALAVYIWKKRSTPPDPPKVTNLETSCISIPSPGGFDRLCHTDAPYGAIGANIKGIKPGILAQHPSKFDAKIKDNLVMVEVHAFGLNYADCCIRWGLYSSAEKYVGWPITPGFEFSGKVIWIGNEQRSAFKVGDEVFGVTMFGAYCTQITVPQHQLLKKPKNISMSQAAGFLCTGITAYYAVYELAAPTMMPYLRKAVMDHTNAFMQRDDEKSEGVQPPKQCVLVHSASGGVGSMLVQFCKGISNFHLVVGIVGGQHKVETAKKLGCDIVIDRKSDKLQNGNIWDEMKAQIPDFEGFDVIFDANGVATLQKSYDHLKATGRLVVYGFHTMLPHSGGISPMQWLKIGINALKTPSFSPLKLTNTNKAVFGFNLSFLFSRTDILEIGKANLIPWLEQERIEVCKVTQYKMKDVAKAHQDIQSGKTIGKLVMLTPFHADYKKI